MASVQDSKSDKIVIWFSRALRWILGSFFIGAGIIYYDKGAWPAILFGTLIFVTAFFRPKRCLEEGCEIDPHRSAR